MAITRLVAGAEGSPTNSTGAVVASSVNAAIDLAEKGNVRNVGSLKDLLSFSAELVDGQKFDVTGFYAGTDVGGGVFRWDASASKVDHNGGTVIAPEALTAWDGTQGDIATLLDWAGAGSGCFVRSLINEIYIEFFGAANGVNCGKSIRSAAKFISDTGGGELVFGSTTYDFDYITLYRGVVLVGHSEKSTVLKCSYDSAVVEVVASENFLSVVDSDDGVAENPLVPSWFGIKNMQIDLNGRGTSTYGGVSIYGAAPLIENVLIHSGANRGLYTEYAKFAGDINNINSQEEGYVINLICRDNGGDGWYNLGPHNVYIGNYIGCLNGRISGGWGYYSSATAKTLGAPTYADCIHCYSNDMTYDPLSGLARKNIYIGVNMSCGLLVVDGGYCEIASDESLISIVKQYLGGQGNSDGVLISGDENSIGSYSGRMRNDGTSDGDGGEVVLRITGNNNSIGNAKINGTTVIESNSIVRGFGGLAISGNGNNVNAKIRDSRIGLDVTGSDNTVTGSVTFAGTAFNYGGGTRNKVSINVLGNSSFGSTAYVSGSSPTVGSDKFDIRAEGVTGLGVKRTSYYVEKTGVDATISTAQSVSIPHNLLYTPRRQDCTLTVTGATGALPQIDYMRVVSADATNVNIEIRLQSGGSGTFNVALSAVIF